MEKQLNEIVLRITGKANVSPEYRLKPEELGNDFKVELKGTIVKISEKDNFDGTFDRQFNIRILEIVDIKKL